MEANIKSSRAEPMSIGQTTVPSVTSIGDFGQNNMDQLDVVAGILERALATLQGVQPSTSMNEVGGDYCGTLGRAMEKQVLISRTIARIESLANQIEELA